MTDDTLLKAAGIAGGIDALARHLRVPKKQLGSWMEGEVETPRTVSLRAVDFLRGAPAVAAHKPNAAPGGSRKAMS
jgi:hypothetical protein